MENNNNKSGNNFFSGFLLGAIVGGLVVFLLGTKKGKKILKIVSEEGFDNITNIIEKIEKKANLDEVVEESIDNQENLLTEKTFKEEQEEKKENLMQEEFTPKEEVVERPKVRRFFRGVSRHLN